jgi:hypothetical protein
VNRDGRDRVDLPVARPNSTVTVSDWAITACAALFVAVLALSAYWDPTIRTLHVFEAVPYVLAGVLCLRQRTFGYALAAASGAFWLWCAGFLTTFIRNGFERLGALVRTGSVDRPDVLISVPAALATAGLIVFSMASYVGLRNKSWRDVGVTAIAFAAVPLFFLTIFNAFAPQYLGMFKGVLW